MNEDIVLETKEKLADFLNYYYDALLLLTSCKRVRAEDIEYEPEEFFDHSYTYRLENGDRLVFSFGDKHDSSQVKTSIILNKHDFSGKLGCNDFKKMAEKALNYQMFLAQINSGLNMLV